MRTHHVMCALLAITPLMAQETATPVPAPAPQAPTPAVVSAVPVVPPAAPVVVEPLVVAAATSAPIVESTTKAKDTLSVDFPDEDVRNILRNVADLFELNLVLPDTLQGRTSLKLRDVTWRQIFQVVLSPAGFTFVEDGNIIKIVSQDSLALEPVVTEIFIINYAKADEIRKSIDAIIDPAAGGKVIVDTRSNSLVITERPTRIGRIRPIIEKLDKATDQVMIESKFIEVNGSDARNLGLDWTTTGGLSTGGDTTYSGAGTSLKDYKDQFGYATTVLSGIQFASTLNFLQNNGTSKVVSNPTVVTLNNTEAFINVGQEYPIPSYTYNAERGAFEISGFEYKPIGVILKVTPQINSRGFVKLTIEPEISSSTQSVNFGGGGGSSASIPIIDTRKTKTQVSLKDGHTLGIGGLISDQITNQESKLPFFGSIPGIGRLFRNESKSTQRRNLLIFITAKIVSSDTASIEEIFDPRQVRGAELHRSDISGYRETESALIPEGALPSSSVKK
jgi:type IV pilus assembly protein PilQ